MKLVQLAGHTVDLDLIPKDGTVLDVGCRGLDFITAMLEVRPKANVLGLDPGEGAQVGRFVVLPFALVGDDRKEARYCEYSTGEGNFLTDLPEYYDATFRMVKCITIPQILEIFETDMISCLKLDCEGSEYGIIEAMKNPVARQISVEFHDSGYTPGFTMVHTDIAVEKLTELGYCVQQHMASKQGDGYGHWDSLFVLP